MKASLKCLAVAALAVVCFPAASARNATDVELLNFALNLKCLEAEFYTWAAFGKSMNVVNRGGGPESRGGKRALLSDLQGIFEKLAREEIKHIQVLRSLLGVSAVACPLMDIGAPFAAAYDLAFGSLLEPPFNPYSTKWRFLLASLVLEDVAVMALNGVIDSLTSPAFITVGRKILAVEAYHASFVRYALAEAASRSIGTTNPPRTIADFTNAIGPTLAALLGLAPDALTIGTLVSPLLAPTDADGLALSVPYTKVLNVLYLGSASTPGAFFPRGLTGYIR